MNAETPSVLTVAEAAKILRLAKNTCYGAIHRGELPAFRVGRRLLVPRDALERLLFAAPVKPKGEASSDLEREEKRILEWNPDA